MFKNQKLILYSLGGAAVIAGAYIYFNKRKITIEQQINQLFHQFSQEIINDKQLNQGNYQLKYDKLLHLSTYDKNDQASTLSDKITFLDTEQLKNQGSCTQVINIGAVLYECIDCCPSRQENTKITSDFDENASFQTICEDCFKASGHQNHKFLRHEQDFTVGTTGCQCGISNLVDKKCFCKNHQGFDKIKQLHYDQIKKQPLIWKEIERFLIDSFYCYFETVSILLSQKIDKANNTQTYNQKHMNVNYFLQLIINKINEILELNPPSIFFMADLFFKNFDKPISLSVKRNTNEKCPNKYTRLIQKEKQINNDLTILDCLLLTHEIIDKENDLLICKLFNSMAAASDTFAKILCEKFYKMIGFTARIQISQDEWKCLSALPPYTNIVMGYIFLQSVFDHLINTLGEDIFNLLEYLTFYIKNNQKFELGINENLLLLPCIIFDMFRMINQMKILMQKYPKQLLNSIFDLNFELFFSHTFSLEEQLSQQQLFEKQAQSLIFFPQYFSLQTQLIDSQIFIQQVLCLINDHELTQQTVSIICETFAGHIVKLNSELEEREKKNQNYVYFSISSLVCLPYLIAISEKKMFTKHSIQHFFDSHFTFLDDEVKKHFFICLRKVLSSFAKSKVYQLSASFQNIYHINPQIQEYVQQLDDCLQNPQYLIYDFYQILSSIIILANDNFNTSSTSNSLPQILISDLKKYLHDKNQNNLNISYENQFIIAKLLLDSTPLLNLFSQKLQLFFPEISSSEDNQIKRVIKKNVEEIIVTCVQVNQLQKMNLNDVLQICQPYIKSVGLVKEYHLDVLDQNENTDLIFLKKQYRKKFYQRNLMRNENIGLEDIITKIGLLSNDSTEDFSFAGSDSNIEYLFPYQQDLFKQLFLDEEFVKEMINLHFQQGFLYPAEGSIKIIVLIFLKFITQIDQNNILDEQEKIQINKIVKTIPLERLKNNYSNNIIYLKFSKDILTQKTSELIIQMLDNLQQLEKSENESETNIKFEE